jgi:dTMP kinase
VIQIKSKIIVIDGLDGSGKTTQAKILAEKLKKEIKIPVNFISFPRYENPSSALVRMYLSGKFGKDPQNVNVYAATSFFAVDRYADFKLHWEEKYKSGEIFILDRYISSNTYYQLAKIPEREWESFINWHYDYEYNKLGLPKPDIIIFLKLPVCVSQKLMTGRYKGDNTKKDVHESNTQFLKRCEKSSDFIGEREKWICINCLDDFGNLKNIEMISHEINQKIKVFFNYMDNLKF